MAKTLIISFLAATFALAVAAPGAQAQPRCYEHGKVLDQFLKTYKEVPVAAGLTGDGRMLEVLSSGDTGTWTIVLSKPNGVTCVVMAGEAWRKLKAKPLNLGPNT